MAATASYNGRSLWAKHYAIANAVEQEITWMKILGGSETLCYNAIAIVFNKTSLKGKYLGNDLNNTFCTQIIYLNDSFWNTYSTNKAEQYILYPNNFPKWSVLEYLLHKLFCS